MDKYSSNTGFWKFLTHPLGYWRNLKDHIFQPKTYGVEAATASVELSKCCERDLGFGRAAEGDPGCDMGFLLLVVFDLSNFRTYQYNL